MNGSDNRAFGAWAVACALVAIGAFPLLQKQYVAHENANALRRATVSLRSRPVSPAPDAALPFSVRRLDGLLASWETIGGCGAGSSTGAGGGVKWIGRSTSGGAFQLQTQASYLKLPDGYNLGLTTQVSRDLSDKWNIGLSVPVLYKYYRDYYGLAVDISNAGIGDISGFITRKFGEINDTALTLSVGAPTGVYDAKYKNDYLTQEKQLGAGMVSGGLTLDHTMDQQWGLMVLGGSFGYRGGQNKLGNYRAPVANVYGYCGYFAGPFVPSLGLTLQSFLGVDRDRGLDQEERLMSATGTVAMEWSTDSLALIAGFSLPFGWYKPTAAAAGEKNPLAPYGLQPWTVALGLSVSPF